MDFIKKSILYFKKPKIIIVAANENKYPAKVIFKVLKPHFKVQKLYEKIPDILSLISKEIFIIETDFKNYEFLKNIKIILKNSQLPILVITHIGMIKFSQENLKALVQEIPSWGSLIFNSDEKIVSEINKITNSKSFSFGFSEQADFMASDISEDKESTSFKLNYKGNSVPVWLNQVFNKDEIYNVLSAICVGMLLGLNIIEMSDSLKDAPIV